MFWLEKDDWFCPSGSRDVFGSALGRGLQSRPEPGFVTGSGEGVCSFHFNTNSYCKSSCVAPAVRWSEWRERSWCGNNSCWWQQSLLEASVCLLLCNKVRAGDAWEPEKHTLDCALSNLILPVLWEGVNFTALCFCLSSRLLSSCRSCSWPRSRSPCCLQSSARASSSSKSRFRRPQAHPDASSWANLAPGGLNPGCRRALRSSGIIYRLFCFPLQDFSVTFCSKRSEGVSFTRRISPCFRIVTAPLSEYFLLPIKQIETEVSSNRLNSELYDGSGRLRPIADYATGQ